MSDAALHSKKRRVAETVCVKLKGISLKFLIVSLARHEHLFTTALPFFQRKALKRSFVNKDTAWSSLGFQSNRARDCRARNFQSSADLLLHNDFACSNAN